MTTAIIRTLFARDPDFIPDGVVPACREDGVDPEWFFPVGDDYSDARKVCRRCPVEEGCADWAVRTGERYGLYGGLDPQQRSTRRRMWKLTP